MPTRRQFLGTVIGTIAASGLPFLARPARAAVGESFTRRGGDGGKGAYPDSVSGHGIVGFDGWSIGIFAIGVPEGIAMPAPLIVAATPHGWTATTPTLRYSNREALTFERAELYDADGAVQMVRPFESFTAECGDYIDIAMTRCHEGRDELHHELLHELLKTRKRNLAA